jgi:sulfur-oxidizing protein SoxA
MRAAIALALLLAAAAAGAGEVRAPATFLSPDLRALQDDPSRHPGWLWVDSGEAHWRAPPAGGRPSCQGCHGDIGGMRGVATRYPQVAEDGRLLNLEGRIETCRSRHQQAPAYGYESEPLLSLTAAVALQSRGLPTAVATDGPAASFVAEGRRLFETRMGQLNLSCAQCHAENVGRAAARRRHLQRRRHRVPGLPARMEHHGVAAPPAPGLLARRQGDAVLAGVTEYLALELYLAARAQGLPIEAPASDARRPGPKGSRLATRLTPIKRYLNTTASGNLRSGSGVFHSQYLDKYAFAMKSLAETGIFFSISTFSISAGRSRLAELLSGQRTLQRNLALHPAPLPRS